MNFLKISSVFKSPRAYLSVLATNQESISQDEFFSELCRNIAHSAGTSSREPYHDSILVYGYDKEFMNNENTICTILSNIQKRKEYAQGSGEHIRFIVSESDDISGIARILKEDSKVIVKKAPFAITKGFIVYGGLGMSTWDSERKTEYASEAKKVIFRDFLEGSYIAGKYAKEFERIEEKILAYKN